MTHQTTAQIYQFSYSRSAAGRYRTQKAHAKTREIVWGFTFVSWWAVWQESGHWQNRGRTGTGYVMSRHNDTGPYSPENTSIQLASDNSSQSSFNKAGLPKGVTKRGRIYLARKNTKYLGYFKTIAEAQNAYNTFSAHTS